MCLLFVLQLKKISFHGEHCLYFDFALLYMICKRVPIVGGNRLDLHQLFIDVTTRGGFEKVYDFQFENSILFE